MDSTAAAAFLTPLRQAEMLRIENDRRAKARSLYRPGEMRMRAKIVRLLLLAGALAAGSVAYAADTVKIGILWPLTGTAAAAGQAAKAAAEVALDTANTAHPEPKGI